MVERKEATADIVVNLGQGSNGDNVGDAGSRLPVEELSFDKEIDIESINGAGHLVPSGYAINGMSYSGEMTLKGNRKDLEQYFFDDNGVPKELESIVITHYDDSRTALNKILVTNQGYESSSGDVTETSFEFIAMSKDKDKNPTYQNENDAATGNPNQ